MQESFHALKVDKREKCENRSHRIQQKLKDYYRTYQLGTCYIFPWYTIDLLFRLAEYK